MQDWLPEEQLAHFINDTANMLDLGAFHARPATTGAARTARSANFRALYLKELSELFVQVVYLATLLHPVRMVLALPALVAVALLAWVMREARQAAGRR